MVGWYGGLWYGSPWYGGLLYSGLLYGGLWYGGGRWVPSASNRKISSGKAKLWLGGACASVDAVVETFLGEFFHIDVVVVIQGVRYISHRFLITTCRLQSIQQGPFTNEQINKKVF